MPSIAECPYCGSSVHTQKVVDYDNKIKLRCSSCGGLFEYMPGFGSFSLPDQELQKSVRYEGSVQEPYYDCDEPEAPWTIEKPPLEEGDCGKCCAIACLLCFILPVISWFILILSILDLIF